MQAGAYTLCRIVVIGLLAKYSELVRTPWRKTVAEYSEEFNYSLTTSLEDIRVILLLGVNKRMEMLLRW